jgi:methyl-accepting chemotaxis protein
MLQGLKIGQRFMLIVAAGLVALAIALTIGLAALQEREMEEKLDNLSQSELTSLRSLITEVMAKRIEDPENIGIAVFNSWFASRNKEYAGEVWSAWGPKVAKHMKENENREDKPVRDAIDREAIATGKPVGRLVDGYYRYSLPIILGSDAATKQEVCYGCHGAMEMVDGEVIAVLSSKLSVAGEKKKLYHLLIIICTLGVVLTAASVIGLRFVLKRMITRPIGEMTDVMSRIAGGDVSVDLHDTERKDEIGDMARAVSVFKDNAEAKARMEAESVKSQARREARMLHLEEMIKEFEATSTKVLAAVGAGSQQLEKAAKRMVEMADTAASRSTSTAEIADRANVNAHNVASASEALSVSIRDVGQQATNSSEVAKSATVEASEANGRVSGLVGAVEKIDEIVSVINAIAAQTNLLALNATIEAARAGEFGKGFAIVAGEVKHLAKQTVDATEQIANQISAIQQETGRTAEAIRGVSETIGKIDNIASQIAETVGEQEKSTHRIAINIDETAKGSSEVSNNMSELTHSIEETDQMAKQVLSTAGELARQSTTMQKAVESFLAGIRKT